MTRLPADSVSLGQSPDRRCPCPNRRSLHPHRGYSRARNDSLCTIQPVRPHHFPASHESDRTARSPRYSSRGDKNLQQACEEACGSIPKRSNRTRRVLPTDWRQRLRPRLDRPNFHVRRDYGSSSPSPQGQRDRKHEFPWWFRASPSIR